MLHMGVSGGEMGGEARVAGMAFVEQWCIKFWQVLRQHCGASCLGWMVCTGWIEPAALSVDYGLVCVSL